MLTKIRLLTNEHYTLGEFSLQFTENFGKYPIKQITLVFFRHKSICVIVTLR